MVLDEKGGRAEGGEGDLGGLLEGGGLASMKKGSYLPQEAMRKLDPLEDQKNDKEEKEKQRKEWRKMMEGSRRRQDELN